LIVNVLSIEKKDKKIAKNKESHALDRNGFQESSVLRAIFAFSPTPA